MKCNHSLPILLTVAMLFYVGCDDKNDPPVPPPPAKAELKIAVQEISTDEAFVRVESSDATTRYYVGLTEKSEFVDRYDGSPAKYAEQYIEALQQADPGTELGKLLDGILKAGEFTKYFPDLTPDTEYTAFAVVVNDQGKCPEEGVTADFRTEPVPVPGLEIVLSDPTSTSVVVEVKPTDESVRYYTGMQLKSIFDKDYDSSPKKFVDDYLNWMQLNNPTFTMEEILERILQQGTSKKTVKTLAPETEYTVFAVVVTDEGTCPNEGVLQTFRTEPLPPVEKVDCTFAIELKDLKPTGVTIAVTPSKDDVAYFFDAISDETYRQIGASEAGLGNYINEYLSIIMEIYKVDMAGAVEKIATRGPGSRALDNELGPVTKYYAYAIGLNEEGRINTEVEMVEFTTPAQSTGINEFTIDVADVTSSEARVAIYPSNADAPYIVHVEKSSELDGLDDAGIVEYVKDYFGVWMFDEVRYGDYEKTFDGLEPATDYTVVVFGYDDFKETATTAVKKETFRTQG